MQPKEIALVAIGAVFLTNLSIVGTLLATGHFSDGSNQSAVVETSEPTEERAETSTAAPAKPALHSLWQATFICEDKVISSNSGKHIAHEVNSVASRYSEDEGIYRIFIDTKTSSSISAPQEAAEVTCEVSSDTMTIVGYKSMKE